MPLTPGTRSAHLGLWILILLAAGCGESETPAPPGNGFAERLVGDYTARADSAGGMTTWMRLSAAGDRVTLTERDNGIRGAVTDQYVVIDESTGAVQIDGTPGTATLSNGDSLLTLSLEGQVSVTVFTRTAAMPDPEAWVLQIQLLEEFDVSAAGARDLSWDGTGLWFPEELLGAYLRRMNPAMNLQIDSILAAAHAGNAIAHTPMGYWVDDGGDWRLYMLNASSGATLLATTFVAPSPILGLTTLPSGTVCIAAGNAITRFDMIEGILDTLDLHQPAKGLEAIDSVLFVALGPAGIARLEGPPWHAQATYALPGLDVHGLAFDGTAWWLSVTDRRAEAADRVVRAALPPHP